MSVGTSVQLGTENRDNPPLLREFGTGMKPTSTTPGCLYRDSQVPLWRDGMTTRPSSYFAPSFDLIPLLLKVVRQGRSDRQDNCDRTSGPMPAAMRWGRAATLRAASAGLDGSEARPLMLFQQSAELGVLRPQGSLCITHTVMIADRPDARQASPGVSRLPKVSARQTPYKISSHPGSLAVDLGALGGPARRDSNPQPSAP
jgi:hypothetical protein